MNDNLRTGAQIGVAMLTAFHHRDVEAMEVAYGLFRKLDDGGQIGVLAMLLGQADTWMMRAFHDDESMALEILAESGRIAAAGPPA